MDVYALEFDAKSEWLDLKGSRFESCTFRKEELSGLLDAWTLDIV